MKKSPLLFLFLLIFFSCQKEKQEDITGPNHNVIVIAKGSNCGNSYLLKFDDHVKNLPNNYQDFTYNEINLPEKFKEVGKELQVNFRVPSSDEYIDCLESFVNYPQVYITSAKE